MARQCKGLCRTAHTHTYPVISQYYSWHVHIVNLMQTAYSILIFWNMTYLFTCSPMKPEVQCMHKRKAHIPTSREKHTHFKTLRRTWISEGLWLWTHSKTSTFSWWWEDKWKQEASCKLKCSHNTLPLCEQLSKNSLFQRKSKKK